MAKILVIDDEPSITNLVSAYLKPEGYEVYTAADGNAGLKAARAFKPDLIILDVMLPGMDGIELLSRLRRESEVYVIMLTARTEETDKIVGLSVGADDYMTKPFSPRELVARVKAALRRLKTGAGSGVREAGSVLSFMHIRIDTGARTVHVDEDPIELTAIEFDLLKTLAENRGRVLTREQLLEKVWGGEYFGEMRVVDVHLGHVRQKLGRDDLITTVRGVGYRFQDETL
jgi:two-component system, OmpR family, alkaline phosphatase synthesis response regulator PhoP